jgi:hypothetical protein
MSDALTLDYVLGSIARGTLPWEKSWAADFSAFGDRYTLHDSVWAGIFLDVCAGNEAVLVVEWDAHWLPEPLRTECMILAAQKPNFGNPFLLMRLSEIHAIELRGYEVPLSGRAIGSAEESRNDLFNRLTIIDIVGGTVHVDFTGMIEFLALRAQDGQPLKIASVAPRPVSSATSTPWWRFWK